MSVFTPQTKLDTLCKGKKDGRGERGGRERKEGTEELGSFDLWSLWLPFSPESQRKHSGNLPRTVFKPCPTPHCTSFCHYPPGGDRCLSWPIPGHTRQL